MRYGMAMLALALYCLIPPAFAKQPAQIMNYELYVGGINAATAQLDLKAEPHRYDIHLFTQTKGLLGKIVPWSGTFDTKGRATSAGYAPDLHESTALTRDKDERKTYKYGADGEFLGYKLEENGKDRTPKKLDPALTENTIDALTATLQLMGDVAAKGNCSGTAEVFDGKRRFKMIFKDDGEDTLTPNAYNIYQGKARRCTLEVAPLGGKWSKQPRGWMSIQEQGIQKGYLPTFWLAPMEKDQPAALVKAQVKTDYGVFMAHLIQYRFGDQILQAPAIK